MDSSLKKWNSKDDAFKKLFHGIRSVLHVYSINTYDACQLMFSKQKEQPDMILMPVFFVIYLYLAVMICL